MASGLSAALVFFSALGLAASWPSPSALISRTARVLNFFPIPVSEECIATDGRRSGTCLNTYDCRIQNGESSGPCALGFGVCCVFAVSCGSMVENNITYLVNPGFPSLMNGKMECKIKIKKMAPDVTQFRLDFIHFNMGQPNRKTGACDSDVFKVTGGSSRDINLCGQNSGQHMYFDVENIKDAVTITMNLTQDIYRIWEIKVSQIEFNSRAPAGCNQYYHGTKGVIQTMNYAINGRHLADQDYSICIRQEEKMCSIAYEPCDDNSFKIGPPIISNDDNGSGGGPVFGAQGTPLGQGSPSQSCSDRVVMPCDTEDFITPVGSAGLCDLLHCGNTFCSSSDGPCRIESSIKPFNIRVQFGPSAGEENPEDNIGMCLRYEQQACT
ncbi:hypothetical protein GE061_017122 [Apolygus lucorum]|uniref:CUB domain-containing protein n=1 Tax=Apolygus lucorum TaxID=248454 RepID=A0A8S9XJC4_APOLU|nr:hypothetical protein GE061_017122 [Apolygus lucorum]